MADGYMGQPESGMGHLRMLAAFVLSVSAFVAVFAQVGGLLPENRPPLAALGWETLRLAAALAAAAVLEEAGFSDGLKDK